MESRSLGSVHRFNCQEQVGKLHGQVRPSSQGLAPSSCLGKICPEPSFVILKSLHHICTVPMANVAEFLGNQSDSI